MATPGVYRQSVHGGKWILISNLTQKVLSLGTFFVLARLLVPTDYGVMGIIFLVQGFLITFTSPDFERALMQSQTSAKEEGECLDAIWTFNFFKCLLLAGVVYLSAPLCVDFFHIPEYLNLIRWSAILMLILGLTNSRVFYFSKNIDYKKFFWRDTYGQVAYIAVTFIWIFYVSRSVWALLAGQIARYLVSAIAAYVLYPNWQKFSFKFSVLKKLFGYAKWVTGHSIIDYILGILDSVFTGHLLNADKLGLYIKARDLSFTPVSPFFTIFDKLGFAAYAKIQDKLDKIQEGFIKTFDVMLAVNVPVFLLLLAKGGLIVTVLLGPSWTGVVVPLKILSASMIFSSLVVISRPLFDALGRPEINLKINLVQLTSLVVWLYLGATFGGLIGVSFAMLVSWFFSMVYTVFKARPILRLGWDKFKATIISVGGASLVVSLVALPLYWWNKIGGDNFWLSGFLILVLGGLYLFFLYLIGRQYQRGPWRTLLSILTELRTARD